MMIMNDPLEPRPPYASRVLLAVVTEPGQTNPFGTLHGGVLLKLADECGAIAALRHSGRGRITTAAIDSMTFLGPVYVGERLEITAVVTYVGRTSIEARIEIHAEPIEEDQRRLVAVGYALYVALDDSGLHPRPVPPLLLATDAERAEAAMGKARQEIRLMRRRQALERGTATGQARSNLSG